jgi:6,7-dimethyl-8-ribityllumazine synthase
VIAPYYTSIAEAQLSAARGVLDKAGVAHETIEVPGSLEIPRPSASRNGCRTSTATWRSAA